MFENKEIKEKHLHKESHYTMNPDLWNIHFYQTVFCGPVSHSTKIYLQILSFIELAYIKVSILSSMILSLYT